MLNRSELKTVSVPVGLVEVTVGSAIPPNMSRYIYRAKFINSFAGPNQLLIGSRENGAVGTTNLDTIQAAVQFEEIYDPDELHEDSAPIYTIHGGPAQTIPAPAAAPATSLVRAATTAGVGILTLWYLDADD